MRAFFILIVTLFLAIASNAHAQGISQLQQFHFDDEPGERHHADHLRQGVQIKRPEQRVCAVLRKPARSHRPAFHVERGAAAPSHTHFRPMRTSTSIAFNGGITAALSAAFASTTLSGKTTLQDATSTNFAITSLLTFNGVVGNSWDDFCVAITGGAGLCDGSDATGASFAYPFPSDATSTLLTFNGGATLPTTALLTVPYASTTMLTAALASTTNLTVSSIGNARVLVTGTKRRCNQRGYYQRNMHRPGLMRHALCFGWRRRDFNGRSDRACGRLSFRRQLHVFNNKIGTSSALTNGQVLVAGPNGNTAYSIATGTLSAPAIFLVRPAPS